MLGDDLPQDAKVEALDQGRLIISWSSVVRKEDCR